MTRLDTKRRAINAVKLAIGVSLVVWLLTSDRFDLAQLHRIADGWPWFLAAQGLFLFCILITLLRWKLILSAFGVECRYSDALRLGMIGLFFNQVALGSTGGDLVKAFYIAREKPERRPEAVFSVFLDRVIGLAGLMFLGGAALLVHRSLLRESEDLRILGWVLGGMFTTVMIAGALLSWRGFWSLPIWNRLKASRPGRGWLARLARAIWTVPGKRQLLAVSLGISLVNHTTVVFIHVCLARAIGIEASIGVFFFVIPVGQLIFSLPLTPGGLGVGEAAYDKLFQIAGSGAGLELALLLRMTWILWGLVGMVFYLRGRREIDAAIGVGQLSSEPTVPAPPTRDAAEPVA